MKRYIIKNRLRFFISISLIMIISMTSVFTLVVSAKENSKITMVSEYVEEGDTIWGLAADHVGEMDMRDYISEVIDINGLDNANIKPGDLLYFPIY